MPEPEPIYEYIPGSGWVATVTNILTMRCGTIVRWEQRWPNGGERSIIFYSYRELDDCLDRLKRVTLSTASSYVREQEEDYQCFVLIPV